MVPILVCGVQDIHRTTKDMCSVEVQIIRTGASPEFVWKKITQGNHGKMIVDSNSIVNDKGQKMSLCLFWSVSHKVDMICMSKMTNSFDHSLSNALFMISAITTEGELLFLLCTIGSSKDAIVSMTFQNKLTNLGGKQFQSLFTKICFSIIRFLFAAIKDT